MLKFYFTRSMREIVGHLILIGIPVVIIAFFNFVFRDIFQPPGQLLPIPYLTVITVGFALTFQIYGASLSFEVLGADFFSSMRDRLMASPAEPRGLVVAIIGSGCLISFLQTLAVLLFSSIVLEADLGSLHLTIPIFMISVIVNQLLGTAILLLSRSTKVANSVITIYGSIVPMTVGLYFPLPDGAFVRVLSRYLSPMALANTAILGAMEGNLSVALSTTAVLAVIGIALFVVMRPLVRRLAS